MLTKIKINTESNKITLCRKAILKIGHNVLYYYEMLKLL